MATVYSKVHLGVLGGRMNVDVDCWRASRSPLMHGVEDMYVCMLPRWFVYGYLVGMRIDEKATCVERRVAFNISLSMCFCFRCVVRSSDSPVPTVFLFAHSQAV